MQEIATGLWRWTGWHEEWKEDVGCVYYEAADAVCLIDPLVPPEDAERFLEHLDSDVARAGLPAHVLITVYWHARSGGDLARRYGGRLWANTKARAAIDRRTKAVSDSFRPGDTLPGDLEALATGRGSEVAYWIGSHRALVVGDALLGSPLRLCPESWLRAGGHAELRASLRPLLDLPVERVLTSHGEPVLEDGRGALRRLLLG